MTLAMRHPTTATDQTVSSRSEATGTSWYRSSFHRLAVLIHRLQRLQRHHHRRTGTQSETASDTAVVKIDQSTPGCRSVRIRHVLASSIKHQDFEPIHPVREMKLSESAQSSPRSRY